MEVTNRQLLEGRVALGALFGQKVKSVKRDEIKLAYKIKKNIDKIGVALRDYEFVRQELVNAFAQKDEKGNNIVENGGTKIQPDRSREFQERIDEEQGAVAAVDIRAFSFAEMENIGERYEISLEILGLMAWMIYEGEGEEE